MDYKRAVGILKAINEGVAGDETLTVLISDLLRVAVAYARVRADYQLAPLNEKREMETFRSAKHNALIDAVNILSRNMAAKERSVLWREQLTMDRKIIGDFACHLHAHLGILAR